MYKIQIPAQIKEGKLLLDQKQFLKFLESLDEGEYILSLLKQSIPKTIDEYRAHYFAMRDIVAEETGNTKKDIHEWAKEAFLYYEGNTTKNLNEEGWKEFIKNFKSEAYEQFNVYL